MRHRQLGRCIKRWPGLSLPAQAIRLLCDLCDLGGVDTAVVGKGCQPGDGRAQVPEIAAPVRFTGARKTQVISPGLLRQPHLFAQILRDLYQLADEFKGLCLGYPFLKNTNNCCHMGTLGGSNHFVKVYLDEAGAVWIMLHNSSRGVRKAIKVHFIALAKKDAKLHQCNLPDKNLAYFGEGSHYFGNYVRGVGWA